MEGVVGEDDDDKLISSATGKHAKQSPVVWFSFMLASILLQASKLYSFFRLCNVPLILFLFSFEYLINLLRYPINLFLSILMCGNWLLKKLNFPPVSYE